MTDYITEGIEKIAFTDCTNFIVERMISDNYDADWLNITERDRQITFENDKKAYKRKRWVDSDEYVEVYDLGRLISRTPKRIEETYYLTPTDIDVRQAKQKWVKAAIHSYIDEYSPFVKIIPDTELIRNCVLKRELPFTPYSPTQRENIRKSCAYVHFRQLIDEHVAKQKKPQLHKKEVLMKAINYNINDVHLFDDLYEYFKTVISGKRQKSLNIDERLKAFAHQQINNKQSKWTLNEFVNETRIWWQNSKRRAETLYKVYSDEYDMLDPNNIRTITFTASQFDRGVGYRSADKIRYLTGKQPIRTKFAKFPLKQNLKNYKLHTIAPKHSFIIDLMFEDNKICYLVAININTRKLFVVPTNIENENELTDKKKTADAYINALKTIMTKTTIKHLRGDGEKAFESVSAKRFYKQNGIDFEAVRRQISKYPDFMQTLNMTRSIKSEPSHSALGLIDRVIRTIRDLAFNLQIGFITPEAMDYIVNLYNSAPHQTLSKYAGMTVSPNDVDKYDELERFVIRRIHQENYKTMTKPGFNIPTGTKVLAYNERNAMAKRRSDVEPKIYSVKRQVGPLFELEGTNELKSRYQLTPVWN